MIKLTTHATERVENGEVALAWIILAVEQPDWTRPDAIRPGVTQSFRSIGAYGGRILRVAHRPAGADLLVITAFFDRGAKP